MASEHSLDFLVHKNINLVTIIYSKSNKQRMIWSAFTWRFHWYLWMPSRRIRIYKPLMLRRSDLDSCGEVKNNDLCHVHFIKTVHLPETYLVTLHQIPSNEPTRRYCNRHRTVWSPWSSSIDALSLSRLLFIVHNNTTRAVTKYVLLWTFLFFAREEGNSR